jgi:hypothetical protein
MEKPQQLINHKTKISKTFTLQPSQITFTLNFSLHFSPKDSQPIFLSLFTIIKKAFPIP